MALPYWNRNFYVLSNKFNSIECPRLVSPTPVKISIHIWELQGELLPNQIINKYLNLATNISFKTKTDIAQENLENGENLND